MLPLGRWCARCYKYSEQEKRKTITAETGNSTEETDTENTQVDMNASPKMTTDNCIAVLEKYYL